MRELNMMETELVGGASAWGAFINGAGAGAVAGSFVNPGAGTAIGALVCGAVAVGLYYL